jgi:hypothetical protein
MFKSLTLILALFGTAAGATDGSYVVHTNPLYFNTDFRTAYITSGKQMAITMACGSPGRPGCVQALALLHHLTDSFVCRNYFFIALIDRSSFAPDDQPDTEPWLEFSYLDSRSGKKTVPNPLPANTDVLDCQLPYEIMQPMAQYLQ